MRATHVFASGMTGLTIRHSLPKEPVSVQLLTRGVFAFRALTRYRDIGTLVHICTSGAPGRRNFFPNRTLP